MEARQIRIDHLANEGLKIDRRRPAEHLLGLRGVAQQQVHLSGPEEGLGDHHMVFHVETDVAEGDPLWIAPDDRVRIW